MRKGQKNNCRNSRSNSKSSTQRNSKKRVPGREFCYLERLLSKRSIASRTEANRMIVQGWVRVNGAVVTNPLLLVPIKETLIEISEKNISSKTEPSCSVVILHKVKGLITTRNDEKGRPTVYTLLPKEWSHLHCVGRLDQATSGLLLLTNDTKVSSFLTDPSNKVIRRYLVSVKGEVQAETLSRFQDGVVDEGEILKASSVKIRKSSRRESHLVMELAEGKNREIRRLCKALGHEVTALRRVQFGPFDLKDLPVGQWRLAFAKELLDLKVMMGR